MFFVPILAYNASMEHNGNPRKDEAGRFVENNSSMKSLTISVADDVYQRASQKAAAAETTLPKVVQDLLCEWTEDAIPPGNLTAQTQRHVDFLNFLEELERRPLKPGPSVGPLNREDLYQRGVPGY